jgi:hypothetical protein
MSITLPDVVQPDGTAAINQVATVPPGTDLLLAALPHREGGHDPAQWTGAALSGSREPDLSIYVAGGILLDPGYAGSGMVTAQGRHAILAWLFRLTGFGYAPAALWKLAGWRIGWIASFLDRLRIGGPEGALIVAERQAAAAIRQMWLALDQPKVQEGHLAASGAVLVGRALIDLVTALDRVLGEMTKPDTPIKQLTAVRRIRTTLAHGLDRYCHFLEEADRAAANAAPITSVLTGAQANPALRPLSAALELTKLKGALKVAQAITSAVALFAITSDHNEVLPTASSRDKPMKASVGMLGHKLAKTKALMGAPEITAIDTELDRLNDSLARLATGAPPSWRPRHQVGLARLNLSNRASRLASLDLVRTDLIYRLIVTRRLDQLYRVLPWMAALSSVFPGVYGGPLGAIAQLFEAGRTYEIALELIRRLYDADDASRLDTKKGARALRTPASLATQVATRTRAGFLLAEGTLSHHMVQAHLAGLHCDPCHPIPTAVDGRLDWRFTGSLSDPATAATVQNVELSKSIYATRQYERDLPRYMGLALVPMFGKAITDIFLGRLRGPGFHEHVTTIAEMDEMLKRGEAAGMTSGVGVATRELMRSVLKALDVGHTGEVDEWRSDDEVVAEARTRELNRADKRINRNTPAHKERHGGAIRRTASKADEAAGSPGMDMWNLIDRARTWTSSKNSAAVSEDEPLELVLEGQVPPPGLVPLGSQFMYPLWFCPDIDRHRLAWLADGAPLHSPAAFGDIGHAGLIAEVVAAMRTSAPRLYARSVVDASIVRVMVIWFTGLSNITADHVHIK